MSFLLSPMRRLPTITCARAFSTTRPSQLARITLVGRIGTDPEFSETSNGQQMMKYVIGSSAGPSGNQTTSWFRVVHFANPDAKSAQYMKTLSKGTLVYLEGDASMRLYDDSEGKKQSVLNIIQTKLDVIKRPVAREDAGSQEDANGV